MKNAKDIVERFNNARLTSENHLPIWPFIDLRPRIDDKRPRLFELQKDWTLVGWCEAPFKSLRAYNDALILEYWGTSNEWDHGLHWIHCRLENMNFTNAKKGSES